MEINQLIGWIGSLMLIFAYFLLSQGKVKGGNVGYQLLNLLGALFIGVNVYAQEAWPVLFLESVWAAIAVAALAKSASARNRGPGRDSGRPTPTVGSQ